MSHYVKKYFNPENPVNQMLVFLHGYNGCIQDVDFALNTLSQNLPNTLIIAPEAEMVSEKNPLKKQWYSLWAVDKEDRRRKADTPLEDLLVIYNQYGQSLSKTAKEINSLIDSWQKEYGLDNQKTVIAGFSQGGMLACYTALTRENFDGRCLMFSAVVAGSSDLEKEQKSYPEVTLFHGKDDVTVNYKTLDFSKDWFSRHKVEVKSYVYSGLAHSMIEDELKEAAKVLSSHHKIG